MKLQEVRVVRIYITEGQHLMSRLVRLLHDEQRVRGTTVFRGIAGFGVGGTLHTASLMDLSMDLPLVLEFFDVPERVEAALTSLRQIIEPGHIVMWPAQVSLNDNDAEQ